MFTLPIIILRNIRHCVHIVIKLSVVSSFSSFSPVISFLCVSDRNISIVSTAIDHISISICIIPPNSKFRNKRENAL